MENEILLSRDEVDVIIDALSQQDNGLGWILYTATPERHMETLKFVQNRHRIIMQCIRKLQGVPYEE